MKDYLIQLGVITVIVLGIGFITGAENIDTLWAGAVGCLALYENKKEK